MTHPIGRTPGPGSVSRRVSRPAYDDLGPPEPVRPLFPEGTAPCLEDWQALRDTLRQAWLRVLGVPSFQEFDRAAEVVEAFDGPGYRATVFLQPTGPETRQTLLLMEPARPVAHPRPGVVVPFYHPDPMAGLDLRSRQPIDEARHIQFGRHLVQQGYVVVCTEAFPYNTVPEPEVNRGFAWWQRAAEHLLKDNPAWTGMARLAWDTRRALDLLLDQPDVDPERVGVMGHSLGGKMAFYAGALDERVRAIVSSDFGIGWRFTNWDAPWYLGDQIHRPDFPLAHHHLLALHAPRSFLLIGGEADRPASWQYLREAQRVYALHGREDAVGFFDHASGHRPTEESLRIAYAWLAEQFGLEERPWEL